ncbi:MAG: hypothetical protein K8S62_08420 [Candidatus Sabulitectum sp.]|nr:hypothetical protein [Candidatus Sabulitectum sp.]
MTTLNGKVLHEALLLWCMTHDPSDRFRGILISMFEELGYEDAAKRL